MKKRNIIAVSVFSFCVVLGTAALSKADNIMCDSKSARYEPHPRSRFKEGEVYSYVIDVEWNYDDWHDAKSPYGVIYTLKIFNKTHNELATKFRMGLIWGQGATPRDVLSVTKNNLIDVVNLNKDLSECCEQKNEMPYAFILPHIAGPLYRIEGPDDPDLESGQLEFLTGENVFPKLGIPEVWVFNKCIKENGK